MLLALLAAGPAGALPAPEHGERELAQLRQRIRASQQAIQATQAELAPRIARHRADQARARARIEHAADRGEAAHAFQIYTAAYAARLDAQLRGVTAILSSLVRMQVDTRRLVRTSASTNPGERDDPERRFLEDQLQGLAGATRELAVRLERREEGAAVGDVLHTSWESRVELDALTQAVGRDHVVTLGRRLDGLVDRVRERFGELRRERDELGRIVAEFSATLPPALRRPPAVEPTPRHEALPRCEPVSSRVMSCRTGLRQPPLAQASSRRR